MNTNSNIAIHQKFEAVTINRQQIKNAPYNPRVISEENFALLKRNIKNVGLVETVVWNSLTGNIVSGHQRIKALDQLEKRGDYDLTVARVELSEKQEKEQNIFMNNSNAQGDWDRDLMIQLIPEIDAKAAGLTDADLNLIGVEYDLETKIDHDVESVMDQFEAIKETNKERAKIEREANPEKKDWREVKKEIAKNYEAKADDKEDYFVLTFDDYQSKSAFLKRFGFGGDDRYVKGEILTKVINDHLGQ